MFPSRLAATPRRPCRRLGVHAGVLAERRKRCGVHHRDRPVERRRQLARRSACASSTCHAAHVDAGDRHALRDQVVARRVVANATAPRRGPARATATRMKDFASSSGNDPVASPPSLESARCSSLRVTGVACPRCRAAATGGSRRARPIDRAEHSLAAAWRPRTRAALEVVALERAEQRDDLLGLESS